MSHGVLRVTFADGMTGEVAVLVVSPGGADLAPDTLYERIRTGVWPVRRGLIANRDTSARPAEWRSARDGGPAGSTRGRYPQLVLAR